MSDQAIITDPRAAIDYVMAGNAKFTLQSAKTGKRYTYSVKAKAARTDL